MIINSEEHQRIKRSRENEREAMREKVAEQNKRIREQVISQDAHFFIAAFEAFIDAKIENKPEVVFEARRNLHALLCSTAKV